MNGIVTPTDRDTINFLIRTLLKRVEKEATINENNFTSLMTEIFSDVEILVTSQNAELLLRAQARVRDKIVRRVFNMACTSEDKLSPSG